MLLKNLLARIRDLMTTPVSPDKMRRDLISRESEIGATLFGPVPAGHTRDFFCLDENTWVWHETWKDQSGKFQSVTTRYEIYPDKVIKAQDGQPHVIISGPETDNLLQAAAVYYNLISKNVYGYQ